MGKLAPPQTLLESVPRTALLEALRAHAHVPLTLLISPPGFGKTTLLMQWRESLLRQPSAATVAWLSLDEADGEANRFLAYLIMALETAGLELKSLSTLAANQTLDIYPQKTISSLLQELAGDGRCTVLIIDDYHLVAGGPVDEVLQTLLERGSQWLHLVIASRSRPDWSLAKLKARGLVHEISTGELVLSLDESQNLLGGGGVQLADMARVHEKTEGWAVAVQLAKLWLMGGAGSLYGLQSFSGSVGDVAEYLAEQIFKELSEECREFLIETSPLERFNADLANTVRGRSDSAALLAQLVHVEALLIPLDAQRHWFRYHALLTEFLRPRLESDLAARIHRAAALWLAERTDWVLAVSHAMNAQDIPLAVKLIVDAGGWELVLRKGIRYTQSLLKQFDGPTRRSEPDLLLVEAYLHAKLGDFELSAQLLSLAQVAVCGDPRLERDFTVIRALSQAYFDQFENINGEITQIIDQGPGHAHEVLGMATLQCVSALAALAHGRLNDALDSSRKARVRMRLVTSHLGENFCLIHEAQALALGGKIVNSRAVVDEALAMAEENFGSESSLKAVVGCFKAQHLYWQGSWVEAQPWIQEGWDSLEHTDGWLDVFAATAEVSWRTLMRTHGLQPALSLLEKVEHLAKERHLFRLSRLVVLWRVDLLTQCGLVTQARQQALAIGLDCQSDTQDWRCREAAALAFARLQLAVGASASACARLKQDAEALMNMGLLLPVWRIHLMELLAGHKSQGEFSTEDVKHALRPILQNDLTGLLLEIGPGLLPVLEQIPEPFPGMAMVMTRLRGWRAHPVRARAQFSGKELHVLELLADGQSNKAIAMALGVSENTVKFHLKQIFRKLSVESRSAAISAALRDGLLDLRQ